MLNNVHPQKKHYDNVTLLITHYNRSKSLERLLKHFNASNTSFFDIVVSDDGSKKEHLDYITKLSENYTFKLVTTPKNKGLGNNINKGQDAINSEYTLYVQEDFIPLERFDEVFADAIDLITENKSFDMVRFYAYEKYPVLRPWKNGFSEMIFNFWSGDMLKIAMYSDHPHLRRSNFQQKFGRYSEMKNPEKTEYDMMLSFLKRKGKAFIYDDYKALFEQVNSAAEPSTMDRNYWRNNENLFISSARYIYRHIKFNYMYFFFPKK